MSTTENTLYVRNKGPQCLEVPLFSRQTSVLAAVNQLLACGLNWYWQSEREQGRAALSETSQSPLIRSLTRLTIDDVSDLVSDLEEIVEEGPDFQFREIHLFGLSGEAELPDQENLESALQRFLSAKESPILIVVIRIPDMTSEYIFFPHEARPEVECLWAAWNINPASASHTRPYKKLRLAQLESTYRKMLPASPTRKMNDDAIL